MPNRPPPRVPARIPLQRLAARVPYRQDLACYFCGAPPPPEGHTADHVPARWLYPESGTRPTEWPTAPFCMVCKLATDRAENELAMVAAVAGGPECAGWNAQRRGFNKRRESLNAWKRRTVMVPAPGTAGRLRKPALRPKRRPFELALRKLGAGLLWLVSGERLADGAQLLVEGTQAIGAPAFVAPVAAYAFGPSFHLVVHQQAKAPGMKIFEVVIFERLHLSIAHVPARWVSRVDEAAARAARR